MPTYRTFPYAGFGGGLNLRDGPDVVREDQAIDAMNVLFNTRGVVGQRSGYAKFTAAAGPNRYDSLSPFYTAAGSRQVVAGAGARLEALDSTGNVLATAIPTVAGPHYFQRFGGPTAEHIYIANGTDALRRWTGTTFETPAWVSTTPTGRFLGLSSTDNRLVSARWPGTVAGNNKSTVRFSVEGDPTNFQPTHYVDLTPGDGEEIVGVASWRDLVFVFKQSKFFIFYGNSVDDDGDPVFNYRPVDAGVGLASPRALAVAEQGVYFLARTGIYFTAGQQPSRVSDLVEPIFHGGPSVYYQGGTLNDASIDQATLAYHDERLLLSFPGGSSVVNNRNLIFDPHEQWWSLADIPAGPMALFRIGTTEELLFGYASGLNHIGRYVEGSYTADNMATDGSGGTAISSYWQGGWFNYATPMVKTIREMKLSGSGLVTVNMFRDYRQTASFTSSVELSPPSGLWDGAGLLWDAAGLLWGPEGTIQPKMLRKAIRGESFSLRLSNSTLNRSFAVHRATMHIREARVPTVLKVQ
jgi:hypothetical protein